MRKIISNAKTNASTFRVKNGSTLTFKNVELQCNKPSYGIWASENAVVNFESGKIVTSDSSCISTNGNDAPGTTINVKGGQLLNSNSYGIYMPAYGTMNISGGEVQGINMRRGTLNITGNAHLISCAYTKEEADNIGEYTTYSGLIWLGDTVAVLAGSNGYIKEDGEEIVINVADSATVDNSFSDKSGEPIVIYALDTADGLNQVVKVNISDTSKVKVMTHEDIAAEATAKNKSYTPKSQTTVFINNVQVYPVVE